MKIVKIQIYEWLLYLILWMQILLFPVLNAVTSTSTGYVLQWSDVWPKWMSILPFIVLFLVHNIILVPKLLFKHHMSGYILSVIASLLIFFAYQQYKWKATWNTDRIEMQQPAPDGRQKPNGNERPQPADRNGMRPPEGEQPTERNNMQPQSGEQPPMGGEEMQPSDHNAMRLKAERPDFGEPQFGPAHSGRLLPRNHRPPQHGGLPQPSVMDTFVAMLMLGFNLAIVFMFRYQREKNRTRELENSHLQHELEYLKAQINPHFFMNMLNNIHGMVEVDPQMAQDMILQLSKLMRYVLYDGANARTPLSKEVAFIANYVSLMRQRYSDKKVQINLRLPEQPDEHILIPPMLFVVFIENAFKHGISYRKPSFVDIELTLSEHEFRFRCKNSNARQQEGIQGGVGLENVRKRLSLLYGSDYSLKIEDKPDTYCVTLTIPRT